VWLLVVAAAAAQEPAADPGALTVERIFGKREFEPEAFSGRWGPEGMGYLTLERPDPKAASRQLVRNDPRSGAKTVLVSLADLTPPGEQKPLAIDDYAFSKDQRRLLIFTNSRRVWRRNTRGDHWVLDFTSKSLTKLGRDRPASSLMFAKFSPDSQSVAYVSERNIYVESLTGQSPRQLTQTESEHIINGTFDWVYEEELDLRDGFRWSPDGASIAYWQLDTSGVPRYPLVKTDGNLYPQVTWVPYPRVGQQNSSSRIGVVNVAKGQTRWLDIPGDPRQHYLARMDWAQNSHELLVQQLNRLQNTNRVMLANVETGELRTVLTEQDAAWIDLHDELFWLDDGRRFTWISERDGWRHVYVVNRDGGQWSLAHSVLATAATADSERPTLWDFEVIQLLKADAARNQLYFIASPDNPTRRFLYRCHLEGSGLERITPRDAAGTHAYQISPDANWAIHTHSTFDDPPVTELIELPSHAVVRTLVTNDKLRERLKPVRRAPTEFFRVEIEPGVSLDGWCIAPPEMQTPVADAPGSPNGKKYPLLVHVYGEPAGQTVADRWFGGYALWHRMLAQRGYVVMSFDNRGTNSPRGRDWRKSIYRQVGILAPQDQAAAVRAVLERRPYLDRDRVGVWGWSGGGSMTLNAIFKHPDLYRTAIAVAPVPNQLYYDTIYQERYMGLPDDNAEGFKNGSPIHFAKQLQGSLLLIHGTGDDNCHYQTTELLVDELIKHNKPFRMLAYPNRSHSISEGANTTRHMPEAMTQFLLETLPAGGELPKRD
jgi:dipeptidyl-peptidase-4